MPTNPPEPTSPEEHGAMSDFRSNIWNAFQSSYEDKWDQAEYKRRHNRSILENLQQRKVLPPWDAVEAQLKQGPPPFLRPGWRSPLVGKRVELDWLDQDSFVSLQGNCGGWRNKKVLLIEFWATIFGHLSETAVTYPDVKVITFDNEGIFNGTKSNVDEVRRFIARRTDMKYPVLVDVHHTATDALFKPSQTLSIPLVFLITPRDGMVHWVGNAEVEDMGAPLRKLLSTL
ncbi:hypothetical protein NLI96_g442 [Meripilus lineatus]|uniref:Thioredoxin domain-containing protein n=1 Tax=Meripilus lineatus TaxID=2056292 RepID=A0AAD5VEQ6_9APHY|nr:hypothetical protein NLI96_g442 [Physisporinus lineatus]